MEENLAPTTYLIALAADRGGVPPTLRVVRRLVARGHRLVVLADEALAADVRATGAEHRSWTRPDDALAGAAADTCRAIGELRPAAVLVSGPGLGALVAAERATVPLGLLLAGASLLPAGRGAWRRLLPELNTVRAAHGLAPLRRVTDQLHRADRHVVMAAADTVIDELEALPGCRPWLLVARHDPAGSAAPAAPEPQLTA